MEGSLSSEESISVAGNSFRAELPFSPCQHWCQHSKGHAQLFVSLSLAALDPPSSLLAAAATSKVFTAPPVYCLQVLPWSVLSLMAHFGFMRASSIRASGSIKKDPIKIRWALLHPLLQFTSQGNLLACVWAGKFLWWQLLHGARSSGISSGGKSSSLDIVKLFYVCPLRFWALWDTAKWIITVFYNLQLPSAFQLNGP